MDNLGECCSVCIIQGVHLIKVSIDNVIWGVKCHSNKLWKCLEYSQRLWRFTFALISLFKWTNWSKYSGTPPYDHPVYKTTSLLQPYSFKPNIKNIDSFYYFEDPVNATTSLLRPGFYGPKVVALTGFHCTINIDCNSNLKTQMSKTSSIQTILYCETNQISLSSHIF